MPFRPGAFAWESRDNETRYKDAAKLMSMDEKAIALIKHRALKEIREHLLRQGRINRSQAPLLDTPVLSFTTTPCLVMVANSSRRLSLGPCPSEPCRMPAILVR